MENTKWLQRKYPESFKELNQYFDINELDNFKKSTMKIGRLNKNIIQGKKYKKGSIVQFRRSNPINSYNHPFVYVIIKCKVGYTQSGYHSFNVTHEDIIELKS